ncbi:hypothetical protein [Nocardia colli]|nr:hypothetical protein [Nocardia colli]
MQTYKGIEPERWLRDVDTALSTRLRRYDQPSRSRREAGQGR